MSEEQRHVRHGRKRHHHRHRSRRDGGNGCHRARGHHNRQEINAITQNSATNLLVNVSSNDLNVNGEEAYAGIKDKELRAEILDDNVSSTCDRNFDEKLALSTQSKYLHGIARSSYSYANDHFGENDKKDFTNHVGILLKGCIKNRSSNLNRFFTSRSGAVKSRNC